MDDYWTDAARPRRRNWWELDEDPDQQNPYPPIGLEGFRPEEPPAIGFNVPVAAENAWSPLAAFISGWLPKSAIRVGTTQPVRLNESADGPPGEEEAGQDPEWEDDEEVQDAPAPLPRKPWPNIEIGPVERRQFDFPPPPPPPIADPSTLPLERVSDGLPQPSPAERPSSDSYLPKPGPVVAGVSTQVLHAIDAAMKAAISQYGAKALEAAWPTITQGPLPLAHLPPAPTLPKLDPGQLFDLGDGLRLRKWDNSAKLEMSDGGLLGTGFLQKWEPLPVDAWVTPRPDGTKDIGIDWDELKKQIGPDRAADAVGKHSALMARPVATPRSVPDARTIPRSRDRREPDCDPMPPRAYYAPVMKSLRIDPPLSEYRGAGGRSSIFGPLPPTLPNPGPGTTYIPGYPAHVKGYRGEHELAHRINNHMPSEQVACPRFGRHRVRCFHGTGGRTWHDDSTHGSSSLRL